MLNLERRHLVKSLAFFMMLLMSNINAVAQTFTDHIRQSENGKATVVVSQSAEIEKLVNNRPAYTEKQMVAQQQTAQKAKEAKEAKEAKDAKEREKAKEIISNKHPQQNGEHHSLNSSEQNDGDMSIPTVDMRKKVMRGGYKVTGYRVQAFAGRNSKNDRIKAESVGNAIKMKYPDQPVYVHFYSPRWICRVGNYRTYEEAAKMLKLVKAMGYSAATIVKGQITVKGGQ